MSGNVVNLFPTYKASVPAVVPQLNTKELEKDAVSLVADFCIDKVIALYKAENSAAFNNQTQQMKRLMILHRAHDLAKKEVAVRLERMIFTELGLMGNDPPLPPGPPSTYSA